MYKPEVQIPSVNVIIIIVFVIIIITINQTSFHGWNNQSREILNSMCSYLVKEETNFWKFVGPIAPVAKGQQNIATIGKGTGKNSISMSCPHPILGTPGPEIITTQLSIPWKKHSRGLQRHKAGQVKHSKMS